ncbi:ABC transporter substrate-binding protein [Microlunatus sp. GCM10028923]|uniref:ABC transporter substrate-binding protein n=1 Tax=Microlunatus sp. GCM10028923 TaxID=3273400 RepID=UPI00361DC285
MRSLAPLLVVLLLITGCARELPAGPEPAPTGWSYTTAYGETITLASRPDVIITDAYSAASLWEYGIRPAGVFGYGLEPDSSPLSLGNADPGQMTVLGRGAELDLEAVAALQPDLIIGYGNEQGDGWTWWDEAMIGQVTEIAPFAGIRFGRPVEQVIDDYAALAVALGAPADDPKAAAARADFDRAKETLRQVAAERPELSTIAVNADPDQLYLGSRGLAQLRLITDLGVRLAGPGVMKDEAWQVLSWELLPDHPADVVLAHAGSTPVFEESAAYQSLPAIKAGQAIPWDDKSPYTHVHYAAWLNQLAELYRSAADVA